MFVSHLTSTLKHYAMIQVNNLTFKHRKQFSLFKDLNFEQNSGNIVGLLGKNGAGKSTFLKLLSGLIMPQKGTIYIDDCIPFKRNPHFLENIFLVTEEPYLPSLTIKAYTKGFAPLYKNFDLEKLQEILKAFDLTENQKLDSISHGQQKKFIIAFALASNCKILLFDEPTNGLDIPSKSVFRKVLVNSVEDDQLVIISTHQVKDIENIIDKIVVLENGNIVFEKDTYLISEKIKFQKLHSISESKDIIYYEKYHDGYHTILPVKSSEDETNIDIELLFNAICNKAEIKL